MSESHTGRKPGKEPWCWQPKAALKRIRDSLDAENAVASGLLVYVALTEIASDKHSNTFQTTHSFIAMRSGLSQRTVQQRIKGLTDIGVLGCVVPSLRTPATYTLLPTESKVEQHPLPRVTQPLHNDEQPLPCVTQRSKNAPLPTSKECIQEYPKNEGKKEGTENAPLKLSQRISYEKELTRIGTELSKLGRLKDYDESSKSYKRIQELTERQMELRTALGVKA